MKLDTQGTGISCYRAAEYGDCSIHVPDLFLWPPSPRFLRAQSKQTATCPHGILAKWTEVDDEKQSDHKV